MKIYTKAGDDGTTGLLGGERVEKSSFRISAIGEVDELNATIGVARSLGPTSSLDPTLESIQHWLFDLGAQLASPGDGRWVLFDSGSTALLEQSIDTLTDQLPPLKQFILPGGSPMAASLHMARTVCRRAERSVLRIEDVAGFSDLTAFLNRLSDWLFVAARFANQEQGYEELKWQKPEDR